MRWLIVGADGMLGRHLFASLRQGGIEVAGTSRRKGKQHLHLDLGQDMTAQELPPADIVVIAAAMTRVADCEHNPQTSHQINVAAPIALAKRMWQEQNAFVVFISSSGVFDGVDEIPTADTQPRPLNLYGTQKAEAENALTEMAGGEFGLAIIRPTKILASTTPLLREWEAALERGAAIHPHAWRSMAPLSAAWAAQAIITIAAGRTAGIWHLSAAQDVSFADFAKKWAAGRGLPLNLIEPEQRLEISLPRARIDMQATMQRFGLTPPALDTVVSDLCTRPLDESNLREKSA